MPRHFHVIAALLTPFTDDGDIHVPALRAHLNRLADCGIDGVMTAGTTGEGPLLTDDETLTVLGEAVDVVAGRLRVYAHVGRIGTAATVDLARRSVALGADAVTAVCPFYYTLTQAELVTHSARLWVRFRPRLRLPTTSPAAPATTSPSRRSMNWPTSASPGSRTPPATPAATAR